MNPSPELRVMTYNIRWNNPNDGVNAWPHRRENVCRLIEFNRIQLAGLQEVVASQMEDLRSCLPRCRLLGVGRDDGSSEGEFAPILYDTTALSAAEWGTVWLSETPNIVGSRGWDAALPRIATWARLKSTETGLEVICLNTHFDHIGSNARLESARLIREFLSKYTQKFPVIVMGDFNCLPDSGPIRILTDTQLKPALADAFDKSESGSLGARGTWNSFSYHELPTARIDYIFISDNIGVARHAILNISTEGLFPSDHFPVIADLTLPVQD